MPERSERNGYNDGTCNGWNPAFCGERLDDGGEGTGTGRLFSAGRGRGILPGTDQTGDPLAPITGIRIIMDIRGMERQAAEKNPNARSKRRMKSAVQGPVYPAPCGGDKDLQ